MSSSVGVGVGVMRSVNFIQFCLFLSNSFGNAILPISVLLCGVVSLHKCKKIDDLARCSEPSIHRAHAMPHDS